MRKRNERRSRIEAAFNAFRSRIATSLGAADNERDRIYAELAEQEFSLRIAEHGVTAVEREPSRVETESSAAFTSALDHASTERDEIYAEWSAQGPQQLTELVTDAAPASAGLPWTEWLGRVGTADATTPAPELWRIGTAEVPSSPAPQPFPLAVPLLDEAHLRITSTTDNPGAAESLVQDLLLRIISFYQPGLVRIHVWDVAQLTGTLPGLFPLTRAGLLTAHDPTRLEDLLDELSDHILRIHDKELFGEHSSLQARTMKTGQRREPWRIAVLFGHGIPLRDEQQHQLQRVARNGLACGIHLILVDLMLTVNSALESVSLVGSERVRSSMSGPDAEVHIDDSPPRDRVSKACSAIAEDFKARRSHPRTFDDLVPDQFWREISISGLQAPIGFREGDPVWVSLGDASPHALIGGPSGSGKTNFLFGLLGSLAARYDPDELELYLLDFKEGVSFAQTAPGRRDPSWLPHARLVGVNVNTDREFGLALLRFLSNEMRRRADVAKAHEVTKLEELRAEDPKGRWPRILAVIDEFQYLFAERDNVTAQATALLEDVARRGRSQGIHLVLASQDVSGIEAFWGKPAIFEQFTLRIALPKARRVLADQNSAALELPRWHAVLNHESGVKHGNEQARIPDVTSKGTFDLLQGRLWERRPAQPPRLFDGSHLPTLRTAEDFTALRPTMSGPPVALLGQVIDVDGTAAKVELVNSPGRNIAVIGSARQDSVSVVGAAARSFGRCSPMLRFTIAALVDEASKDARATADAVGEDGCSSEIIGLTDLGETLAELADSVKDASSLPEGNVPRVLVLYGVDAAQSVLEQKDTRTGISGLENLRTILRLGPQSGAHTIGWWRSSQRLKNTLGMGPVDDIGAWVAFDVQGSELSQFAAGQVVNWSPRARRGLFFDRSTHARPEVILPYDLSMPPEQGPGPHG